MADEPKGPPEAPAPKQPSAEPFPSTPTAAAPKPAAPAAAGGAGASAGAPPKPPAPKAPPAAPKPPAKPDPWSSPLVEELQKRFPGAISSPLIFRNQPFMTVDKTSLVAVCEFLKSDEGGTYTFLTDETAVDYPKREKRFEIIYQLYSFKLNHRLRLKVMAGAGEKVPSVVGVWATANWLEREVYDMFGVEYEGHPDLKRILLPDGWVGHPLRKDYDILKQDDAWVRENLHIESGQ
jgi:NADH-quinone oxidoreductase subunit C